MIFIVSTVSIDLLDRFLIRLENDDWNVIIYILIFVFVRRRN